MESDHFVAATPADLVPPSRKPSNALTTRERDVVQRALRGQNNKEIAFDIQVAHSTVRVLMARAMMKLGARTRNELIVIASSLFDVDSDRS